MTLGRVKITSEKMLSNEAIAQFPLPNDCPISKEYLYFFLKTYPYQSLGSTSSIVTSINTRILKSLEVHIPPSSLMKRFTAIISVIFDKIRKNQDQIRTLTQLRDSLLPKLMNGEVRVKMDETANTNEVTKC